MRQTTKIDEIVACFNYEHIHFLSKLMLQTKQITRGQNLQRNRGNTPTMYHPKMSFYAIPIVKHYFSLCDDKWVCQKISRFGEAVVVG